MRGGPVEKCSPVGPLLIRLVVHVKDCVRKASRPSNHCKQSMGRRSDHVSETRGSRWYSRLHRAVQLAISPVWCKVTDLAYGSSKPLSRLVGLGVHDLLQNALLPGRWDKKGSEGTDGSKVQPQDSTDCGICLL
jgi:hypothetical protein